LLEAKQAALSAHFSAAWRATHADAWGAACRASLHAAKCVAYPAAKRTVRREKATGTESPSLHTVSQAALDAALAATRTAQAALLREVIANPFRPLTIDLAWLSANDWVGVKIAQAI